jgi:tetratricopeptide (TPR) repeat protein
MLLITRRELGYWRDSITIWTHSLEVTRDPAMERQLANALIKADRIDEAAPHLLEAIKLDPEDVSSHANLGGYYSSHGHREDAVREFETTVALTERPNLNMQDRLSRMSALLGLGFADVEAGNFSEAQTSFASAIQVDGPQVDALIASLERTVEAQPSDIRYVELSLLLRATGREQDSNAVLENVVKTSPNYSRVRQLRYFLHAQATGGTKTRTGQEGGI